MLHRDFMALLGTVLFSLFAASSACTPDDVACDMPAPAIVDCNDPLASVWVEEMIGSCDMPPARADVSLAAPTAPPKPRAAQTRLCIGDECGVDNIPLRQGMRDADSGPRVLAARLTFHHALVAERLVLDDELMPERISTSRLDRPPRRA